MMPQQLRNETVWWRMDWLVRDGQVAQQLLWLLLAADLLFLSLHVAFLQGHLSDVLFSIEQDRGFAEVFQYIKQYWIFLAFGLMAVLQKEPHYAAWSILFGYLLVDDWFMLHERAGLVIAGRLPLPVIPGLRARDVGELLFMGMAGALVLPVLALTYMRASAIVRGAGRRMTFLFAVLVGFGAGVDMLHQLVRGTILNDLVATIEDGGEMLAVTLICTYAISLCQVNVSKGRDCFLGTKR
jgi:hypothetical protein